MKIKTLFGILSFLLACVTGCSSNFDVQVSASEELVREFGFCPSLEVDFALASENDLMRFNSYPVEKYYEPQNPLRSVLEPVTMKFSEDDLSAKVLKGKDPVFDRWKAKEPTHLIMIVNLPQGDSESKTLDTRKYVFKLADGMLSSDKDLYIKIGSKGLIRTSREGAAEDSPIIAQSDDQKDFTLECTSKKGQKELMCVPRANDNNQRM